MDHLLYSFAIKLALILLLASAALSTAYFLFFKFYADYFRPLKIQETPYTLKLFTHDSFWSALNISGAVAAGVLIQHLWQNGFIEFNTSSPSAFNLLLEFFAVFFLFDITYYFLHRTLHQEPFYSKIHIKHHKTFNPTFFTAFAFHPLEGVVAGLISVFWVWALDFHIHTIFTILLFQGFMNFSVHSAHEYFPQRWLSKWYTKWFISPTFHDLHHSRVDYNFGGFTTVPDFLFGTLTPDLKKVFDTLKERKALQNQQLTNIFSSLPNAHTLEEDKEPSSPLEKEQQESVTNL